MTSDFGQARRHQRRVLWEGAIGSFGLDDIELPDGRRFTLALIRHPGASAVVPFLDDETILLLRQYRYAAGGPIWEVPAGKLDEGEAPDACAARELEEETGYRPGRLERVGRILTTPGFTDEVIHLFCAFELECGQRALDPHEALECTPVPFEQAVEMVDKGEITDAKSVCALFHADRHRRRR